MELSGQNMRNIMKISHNKKLVNLLINHYGIFFLSPEVNTPKLVFFPYKIRTNIKEKATGKM